MFNVHEWHRRVTGALLVISTLVVAREGGAAPLPYGLTGAAPRNHPEVVAPAAPASAPDVSAPATATTAMTVDSASAPVLDGSTATTEGAASAARGNFPQVAAFPEWVRPAPSTWGLVASIGFRSDLVRGSALDPFSDSDGVPQSALSVAYRLGSNEMSSPLIGLEWDHGETTATARAAEAGLTVDRLSATLEARRAVARKVSAFLRLAPGLMRHRATFYDPSAPPPPYGAASAGSLQQTTWVPAGDLSAGLALRIGETRTQASHLFAFWVVAEGGYGYAGSHELVLSPGAEPSTGRTDEPLRLGQMAFQGTFLRLHLALSF